MITDPSKYIRIIQGIPDENLNLETSVGIKK